MNVINKTIVYNNTLIIIINKDFTYDKIPSIYTIIALVVGVALASQAAINSQLAKAMGNEPLVATFISFGTGTLLLLVISLLKTDLIGHLSSATQHAW